MNFTPIDEATWPRREQFEHYRKRLPTTYALTTEIDVTALRQALDLSNRKTYAAHVWAVASIVNRHEEFRYTLTPEGKPAVWDVIHPAFTVFNPERETFAGVWTPFDSDFSAFHDAATECLVRYRSAETMFPQEDLPPNLFEISTLPWIGFSGFELQITGAAEHLAPIVTFGRYRENAGKTMLPVSVQVSHAVADGFHTARLINELELVMGNPDWLE